MSKHSIAKYSLLLMVLLSSAVVGCGQSQVASDDISALTDQMLRLKREVTDVRKSGAQLPMARLSDALQQFEQARADGDTVAMQRVLRRVDAYLDAYRVVKAKVPSFVAELGNVVNGESGVPSPGSDGYIGLGYTWPGLGEKFVDCGADYMKTVLLSWGMIEPRPPVSGVPHYQWQRLDEHILEYQKNGYQLQFVLKASNPWAIPASSTKEGFVAPGKGSISALPSLEYQPGYARFIASIVERYDGDGYHDMPGLKFPIIYWEVESEAFHEGYWRGSVEEYGKLLEIAYHAAKAASPNCKIILAGLNFSDLFDDAPSQEALTSRQRKLGKFARDGFAFIKESIQFTAYYDAIEIHYNRDYRGLPGILDWLRSEMGDEVYATKEIWSGDTLTTPWLFTPSHYVKPPYPEGRIYSDIKSRKGSRSPAESWFRAEQSKLMVKKLVMGAEQGLTRMILLMMKDRPQGVETPVDKNWMISGLLDRSLKPRPAYYALCQTSPYLRGFKTITRMKHDDPQTYIYKVTYDGVRSPVLFAWSESNNIVLRLESFELSPAIVEHVITDWSSKPNIDAVVNLLPLGSTPVIVRAK